MKSTMHQNKENSLLENIPTRNFHWLIALYCLTFVFISNISLAQTQIIDSLKKELNKASAQDKFSIYKSLLEQSHSIQSDTLLKIISQGRKDFPINSAENLYISSYYPATFFKQGKTAMVLPFTDSLLKLNLPEDAHINTLFYKALGLIRTNEQKEAIQVYLNLLHTGEKNQDTFLVIRSLNGIGLAHMEMANYAEAINWFTKAEQSTNNRLFLQKQNTIFTNKASCLNNINKLDSALVSVNKGLELSRLSQNLTTEANALNIRAAILIGMYRTKEGIQDLNDALKVRERIGDYHYILADMGQQASIYAGIHETDKGIAIALKGIEIARKYNNLSKLIFLYTGLAENYTVAKKYPELAQTLKTIVQLKDSIYEKNSEGAIAEMMTKYELQKKENIIIQQENKLIRGRYLSIAAVLALLLGSIIIYLLYRNYQHVQTQKMLQAVEEEKSKSFVAIQQAEENERKRIAADLHDNLGSYAAAITSNIRFLKEGNEVQPKIIHQLEENAQGIVTQLGDSIWILKNEKMKITQLADRFKAWVQRIIINYPEVKYYYSEHILNDSDLTPTKALNLFLILKEALNNALKHSGCNEIHIQFNSNEELAIEIHDNGKGFITSMNQTGNGLDNMKIRAANADMQLTIQSEINKGTHIIIRSTTN